MADDIDAAFERLTKTVFKFADEVEWKTVTKLYRKAKRIVVGSTDDFYSQLASRFMKIDTSPKELGVSWSPLTKKWYRYKHWVWAGRPRKKSRLRKKMKAEMFAGTFSGGEQYYFGIGPQTRIHGRAAGGRRPHLNNVISKQSVENTLGNPIITLVDEEGDTSDFILTQHSANTVPRVRGRHTGKFVDTSDLSLWAILEVKLAPNLGEGTVKQKAQQFVSMLAGGDEFTAKKIGALESRRPLFRPYYVWYMQQRADKLAKKLMKDLPS